MSSDESGREDLTEVLTELTSQVARLVRVLEQRDTPAETPVSIRYGDSDFLPPRMPRNTSWHQKLKTKKVSLPAATGTSLLIYGVAEIVRLIAEGHIRFW